MIIKYRAQCIGKISGFGVITDDNKNIEPQYIGKISGFGVNHH